MAAFLSREGGSFRIISEASLHNILLITSYYAYQETEQVLLKKYPHFLIEINHLSPFFTILPNPPEKIVCDVLPFIDYKDAPILAAAIYHQAHVIITLDRKHFVENKILAEKLSFLEIRTSGSFVQKYF